MLIIDAREWSKSFAVSATAVWVFSLPPTAAMASDKEPKKILALQQQNSTANPKPDSADGKPSTAQNASNTPVNNTENISSESEASILEFAKREQLQLFELLQYLKQKRPPSYQQALKETGRNKQRLESLKERDPELYEIESQLWRTRSKLSFLAAQMSVQDDADLDKQLETLVQDLETQEIARLTLMRDRTAKQLEKWDSQLKDRKADFSTSVDKNVESWKNRIKKQRSSPKKPS